MSPILVRPVREQLEHDRIIRLLQTKLRRKYEVGINPGSEQSAVVTGAGVSFYPDLVLHSLERGRRLQGVVEVETGESVNHLEALAEWANFARLRAEFHLYVPSGMVEVARRLSEDNQIAVQEIWSYHMVGDEVRFNLVHRSRETARAGVSTSARPKAQEPKVRTPSAKPVKSAPAGRAGRPKAAKPTVRAKTAKKPVRPKKRR